VRFEKVDDISQVAGLVTSRFRPGVGGRGFFLDLDVADGYGSIPIHTIFSGMNIHLPAILMFTRGTRF